MKDKKIDVIILCETWVTKDTRQLINVPGYQYVGIERQNKKGGGVGFLIANEIHFTHRPVFDLMEENIEHCCIEIAMKGRNIMCTSVYRPPQHQCQNLQSNDLVAHGKNKVRFTNGCCLWYGPQSRFSKKYST